MTAAPKSQKGFTLTELMFAMAFVAFIMLFIVTSVIQTMRIYNKGLAIRDINQSGRQISEDITRSLRYADSVLVNSLAGYNSANQRLCANGVSYVWNIEGAAGLNMMNKYINDPATPADESLEPIRLVRVIDRGGQLCTSPTSPVTKSLSKDMLSPQLTVLKFTKTPSENGKIAAMHIIISTQGDNKPTSTVTDVYECPGGSEGAFCAFGDFQTTVYIRN